MRTRTLLPILLLMVAVAACGTDDDGGPSVDPGAAGAGEQTGAPVPVCPPNDPDCNDHPLPDGLEPRDDDHSDGLDGSGNPAEGSDDEPAAELGGAHDGTAEAAQALLGVPEDEVPAGVRTARRGELHMMLTTDHVPGRMTVDLDEQTDGRFTVTSVTLETAEGNERFPDDTGRFPSGD